VIGYVSDGKFFLDGVGYHLREIPKSCGFGWQKGAKLWSVKANVISAIAIVEAAHPSDNLIEIESWLENSFGDFDAVDFGELKTVPRPYQVQGASAIVRRQRFGIFFDMATGKTFTSLMAVNHLFDAGEVGRVLVLCPISLFSTWTDEMRKHLGVRKESVHVLWGTKKKREKALEKFAKAKVGKRHPVFALTSWDTLPSISKEVIGIAPEMVIGDETTFIKSRNSIRTKTAIAVADASKYVVALTGTPYVSNVTDIWSQLRFVSQSYVGSSFWKFANRYVLFDRSPWKKPIGILREKQEELKKLISMVSMTVKKSEVIDLPEKIHQERIITPAGSQAKALKEIVNEFHITVEAAKKETKGSQEHAIAVENALVKAMKIQQISCGWTKNDEGEIIHFAENPKASAIQEILEESAGHSVVVFSRFVEDLEMLHSTVKKFRPVLYHGRLNPKAAEESYQAFKAGEAGVFLCQVQKGGFGIDLTVADVCVYLNNWWSVGVRQQSGDRLHRPGQRNSVSYIDLVMDGGIDDSIIAAINSNMTLSEYLFGGKK